MDSPGSDMAKKDLKSMKFQLSMGGTKTLRTGLVAGDFSASLKSNFGIL